MAKSNSVRVAKPFAFTGTNAIVRNAALAGVAGAAYAEGSSRSETIKLIAQAIGAAPKAKASAATVTTYNNGVEETRVRYVAGTVAHRLANDDFPKPSLTVAERIAFCVQLLTVYAQPATDPKKPAALKPGKIGRRTPAQQKAIAAGNERWSQLKAELGIGAAMTQGERDKAKLANKRAVKGAPASGAPAKGSATTTPTHGELIAPKEVTRDSAFDHVQMVAAQLLAFVNAPKNAKLLPTDLATAVHAFKTACDGARVAKTAREDAAKKAGK